MATREKVYMESLLVVRGMEFTDIRLGTQDMAFMDMLQAVMEYQDTLKPQETKASVFMQKVAQMGMPWIFKAV